jgi:biotin transport system substrate-specific component
MNTKRNPLHIASMTKIALCVAVLCACSYLVIPLPFTPIVLTLHTIIINLIGLILKPKEVAYTILTYILMGLIGLPVFAGGTSGPGKLFGPTGGFYFGFLFAAVVISLLKGKEINFIRYALLTICVGIPIQHLFAVLFMSFYNDFHIDTAILTVSLPFLLGDIIKAIIASILARTLNKTLPIS